MIILDFFLAWYYVELKTLGLGDDPGCCTQGRWVGNMWVGYR